MRGVCSAMCWVRFLRSSSMLAPQARSTSAAVGLSSSASSRCSTVMNSWRFWRASTNAMWRLTSSSWAIICCFSSCLPLTPFPPRFPDQLSLFHHALQGVLMLPGVCRDLLYLSGSNVAGIYPAHPDAFAVHLQHHLGGSLPAHAEELLQHHHHELHGGVVVVQQHDLEHRRRLQLAPLGLQYGVVLLLRHAARLRALEPPRIGQFPRLPVPPGVSPALSGASTRHTAVYRNLCGGAKQCGGAVRTAKLRRFFTTLAHPRARLGSRATLPRGIP